MRVAIARCGARRLSRTVPKMHRPGVGPTEGTLSKVEIVTSSALARPNRRAESRSGALDDEGIAPAAIAPGLCVPSDTSRSARSSIFVS